MAKLMDRRGARQSIAAFGVPRRVVTPLATVLPVAEIAVAVALVANATAVVGALGALVLLGAFIAGIALSLKRGHQPDCGCFGQVRSAPVGWKTLVRDGVLALLAALVVVYGPGTGFGAWASGLTALDWITLGLAIAFAVAFVVEGGRLLDRWRHSGRRR